MDVVQQHGIHIEQPRCPYCHEAIRPEDEQLACNSCRAWHHEACWAEGRERWSACGARKTGHQSLETAFAKLERLWTTLIGVLAAGAFAAGAYFLEPTRHAVYLGAWLGVVVGVAVAEILSGRAAGRSITDAMRVHEAERPSEPSHERKVPPLVSRLTILGGLVAVVIGLAMSRGYGSGNFFAGAGAGYIVGWIVYSLLRLVSRLKGRGPGAPPSAPFSVIERSGPDDKKNVR